MRTILLLAALLVSIAVPALACDYAAGVCAADLQVNYAAPVQQQVAVQAYVAPVQQVRVVQRVVQPQAVYVQPQAQVVLRQKAYVAPVVQQQVVQKVVTPYVQQSLAVQGYGSQSLNLGSRQRLNLGVGGNQRVVTKSKTVTTTRSGGLLGRLLGR